MATCIAVVTLFVGATGVFAQLQDALNIVWKVKRKPGRGLRHFMKARLISFAMILGIGFLLLVSLILSAMLAALGKFMSGFVHGQEVLLEAINFLVSLGVITLLFAMIFRVLPDVKIKWRDVWVVASAYGAAGSLVIVLLWVYYSAQILLLGAEFTRVYANRYEPQLRPVQGAQFVTVKEVKAQNLPDKTP